MDLTALLPFSIAVIKVKLFRKRIPLFASWLVTTRCNYRCRFCGLGDTGAADRELSTTEARQLITELSALGTRWMSLTGGEPLIREDIGEIIDCCVSSHIKVSLNTNGYLLKDKLEAVKKTNTVNLSFYGPENIHNGLCGKDVYSSAIEAMETCRDNRINFTLADTLSSLNLGSIDFVLAKAEEFDTKVMFQPARAELLKRGGLRNPVAPAADDYRKAVDHLISLKRAGNRRIANSVPGLNYIRSWPGPRLIRCPGSRMFCSIDHRGLITVCGYGEKEGDTVFNAKNIREDIRKLPYDIKCNACWCAARVEFNYLVDFDPEVMLNFLRI